MWLWHYFEVLNSYAECWLCKNLIKHLYLNKKNLILKVFKNAGGKNVAIFCDRNRVNQGFSKLFDITEPWLTKSKLFLLFDYVHLMEGMRTIRELKVTRNSISMVMGKR